MDPLTDPVPSGGDGGAAGPDLGGWWPGRGYAPDADRVRRPAAPGFLPVGQPTRWHAPLGLPLVGGARGDPGGSALACPCRCAQCVRSHSGKQFPNHRHRDGDGFRSWNVPLATDPEAQLYTKALGQTAKLSYLGHLLTENRHGLVVGVELTAADGYAERQAAITMLERSTSGRATLGADRGYDTRDFVAAAARWTVAPRGTPATP